jgi:hypothetical protein
MTKTPQMNFSPRSSLRLAPALVAALLSLTLYAKADSVQLGQLTFSGQFTVNHSFNWNIPGGGVFGSFGPITATGATGIFAPYVSAGDALNMNTNAMYSSITATHTMVWSIDGYVFDANYSNIAGADFAGQLAYGLTTLTGNGFNPSDYGPLGAFPPFWSFTAPAYDITNFPADVSGPITITLNAAFDDGHVSEGGATVVLLALGVIGVETLRRKLVARAEHPPSVPVHAPGH